MKLIMEKWKIFLLEQKDPLNISINSEEGWTPVEPKPDMFDSGAQDWQMMLQPEILIPNIKLAMRVTPTSIKKPKYSKFASAACAAYYALSSLMPERSCSPPFLKGKKPPRSWRPPEGCPKDPNDDGNYPGTTLGRGSAAAGADRPVFADPIHGAESISGAPYPPLGPGTMYGLDLPEKQLGALLLNVFGERYKKLNTAQQAMEFFLEQMRWRCTGEKYGPPKHGPLRTTPPRTKPGRAPEFRLKPGLDIPPGTVPAENKTKISKNRLQKIIREEVNLILKKKESNT